MLEKTIVTHREKIVASRLFISSENARNNTTLYWRRKTIRYGYIKPIDSVVLYEMLGFFIKYCPFAAILHFTTKLCLARACKLLFLLCRVERRHNVYVYRKCYGATGLTNRERVSCTLYTYSTQNLYIVQSISKTIELIRKYNRQSIAYIDFVIYFKKKIL